MNHQQDHDQLRARFTQWLEKLIQRARIDYFRIVPRSVETISFEDIPEYNLPFVNDSVFPASENTDFDFEEKRLAKAFYQLPLMKQKILTMLFVEELKPEEIASRLNCSANYVYTQKARALSKLRKLMDKGGDKL